MTIKYFADCTETMIIPITNVVLLISFTRVKYIYKMYAVILADNVTTHHKKTQAYSHIMKE